LAPRRRIPVLAIVQRFYCAVAAQLDSLVALRRFAWQLAQRALAAPRV